MKTQVYLAFLSFALRAVLFIGRSTCKNVELNQLTVCKQLSIYFFYTKGDQCTSIQCVLKQETNDLISFRATKSHCPI